MQPAPVVFPRPQDEQRLFELLAQAAQIEHLLALEYLFAAFSLKKYPEEFDSCDLNDPAKRHEVEAQVERNRRWAAQVLFVARQEMEHLAMVQNLLDPDGLIFRTNLSKPGADLSYLVHLTTPSSPCATGETPFQPPTGRPTTLSSNAAKPRLKGARLARTQPRPLVPIPIYQPLDSSHNTGYGRNPGVETK